MEQKKINKQNIQNIYALTTLQEGMLFHYLSDSDSSLYFEQMSFDLAGEIDIESFKNAWKFVIEQNEMLRTVFRWENLSKPVQIILKKIDLPIQEYNFSSAGNKEKILEKLKKQDLKMGIDISEKPFRILLCKLDESNYEMILSSHHIIFDGWSNGILLNEFLDAYKCYKNGKKPIIKEKTKYEEYIKWLSSQEVKPQEAYWKKYLEKFSQRTYLPSPLKKNIEKDKFLTQTYITRLSSELFEHSVDYAKQNKITLASLLYFVWGTLIKEYTRNDDIVFGTTVSGRSAQVEQVQDIVGLFINTIPFRINFNQNQEVNDFLKEINNSLVLRGEYEYTPLTLIKDLTKIDANGDLFNSIVVIENYPLNKMLEDYSKDINISLSSIYEMTNYDMTLVINTREELSLRFIYDSNIYRKDMIEQIANHFSNILDQIVKNKAKKINEITMLSEKELEHILKDFNNNKFKYDKGKTITSAFEEQVEKTPDSIALEFNEKKITYKELNNRANQLAYYLRKKGAKKDKVIGIMMERSIEMYVSILGILKSGAAYLPIDMGTPADRVDYMLENSNAEFLVMKEKEKKEISFTALQGFEKNKIDIVTTPLRDAIMNFNDLPMPDRSLIDITRYKDKIGMASVNNCISLQTTRGCPYECLYCHKIWSKTHVRRSAENLYNEIEYYYKRGVRNFSIIDDCFNLDLKGSSEFLKLIIKNKLKIQLFFPNGLRGDILTEEFIDLMAEAGTKGINLSLETASPRLQKLLKKNLNLDNFKRNSEYIATEHPEIILEMASMHGFPTETEEEAYMTLNFIKNIQWIHFPYIHILKIFPNTEMEAFALSNGISKYDIDISRNRAFHELPETLPFDKSFTREYQSKFMNEYFLSSERLRSVLPAEMKILDESALIQKYNAYLPTKIESIQDLLKIGKIEGLKLDNFKPKTEVTESIFTMKREPIKIVENAKKILFLDLSQYFSDKNTLYKVSEQPLGQIYLLTYIKQYFRNDFHGKIMKSGIDFDNYEELKKEVEEFKPDIIGIRTLTYFRELFHETVSLLRQWGIDVPIVTGGPYATSDYDTILKDKNVDLVMHGEGEYIFRDLLNEMLKNGFKIPDEKTLMKIKGISFKKQSNDDKFVDREILYVDQIRDLLDKEKIDNLQSVRKSDDLAYVMYTSGSTGTPKGVMIEDKQVNNCIYWMQKEFNLNKEDAIVHRTNYTFDPSVWEILWPLYRGAKVEILSSDQSKNVQYIISLLSSNHEFTGLYCPASMIEGMTYLLEQQKEKKKLKLKYLFIGAEPIKKEIVNTLYKYFDGQIINTYGPTECTINNTYYYINKDDKKKRVPIGKPVGNNNVYIVSKDMRILPINVEGEICISGDSVGRGYINDAKKTNENFIDNLFGNGKLYKTGDIGRWNEDGEIEIAGRVDEQAKIRGYRIEPGDIETALLKNPHIKQSIVLVRDNKKALEACKNCGITNEYSNIIINERGICNICEQSDKYLPHFNQYFKNIDDLKGLIDSSLKEDRKYDCLLMFSGSLGSIYALDQLLRMNVRVLTFTFNNGYMRKTDIETVKEMADSLGVDNIIVTHENTDKMLLAGCKVGSTVCRGCFHISSTLAREYAHRNNIPIIIGTTLSRGQIIENKLLPLFEQGIKQQKRIEEELMKIKKNTKDIEGEIFQYMNICSLNEDSFYENVKEIDFYRYCNITNKEMLKYIKDKYGSLKGKKPNAIYSTDCPIKQIGDKLHLMEKKYHYYGKATSWEKRLGHITLENVADDLQCNVTEQAYINFYKKLGFNMKQEKVELNQKIICAYYVSDKSLNADDLKEYLKKRIPSYMIPNYFIPLEHIKLMSSGKIDKKSLPELDLYLASSTELIPASNEIEQKLVEIWKNVLKVDNVSVDRNFFDAGGNSILLIQLFSQIGKVYPNKISMADLFGYTTIEKMAKLIERVEDEDVKLDVTQVKLPKEFFEANDDAYVSFDVNLVREVPKLLEVSNENNLTQFEMLISIYSYLFYELSAQNDIMVFLGKDEKVTPIKLSFEHISNFKDLFVLVKEALQEVKNEEKRISLDNIGKIKIDFNDSKIVPFINFQSIDNNLVQNKFDLVINVDLKDEEINLNCEYNYNKLNKNKVKELFQRYINLIQIISKCED
ncbi:B12-binding domain-containing radical SAM protein [Clostridium botulinum]|nr:B12-binding domain-containing radical SAM protein [Clostridium botulinum]